MVMEVEQEDTVKVLISTLFKMTNLGNCYVNLSFNCIYIFHVKLAKLSALIL